MLREKEIEEMARVMANGRFIEPDRNQILLFAGEAETLYNAGYRKQSEPISCSHEKGGEWISVDERSPKKWQKCLCYYPEKDYGSKVVVDYAETDSGGFAEQFQFGKPSHWMPLPKAPKMKGDKQE